LTRTKRTSYTFARSFSLKGADHVFPAGAYELVTDEELIEGLSFPAWRRTSSWLLGPTESSGRSSEMVAVNPQELAAAHARDVQRF
jgi:hypothetical protein